MRNLEQIDILKHLADLFMQIGARTTVEPLASFDDDLTTSQLLALRHILLHPDCALSALANGLDISNPAATKVMDRLERKGLVVRVQGSDRRQVKAVLTPRGKNVAKANLQLQIEAYASLFNSMPQPDRQMLQQGLEALVAAAVQQWPNWEQLCLRCGVGCAKDECPLHRYRSA
ncbi:MAG: hypothetical protein FD169_846 [Bacillota bacterium]|nr:MAG: hypothetical protein FD169_846 [Bacillota bacterium]